MQNLSDEQLLGYINTRARYDDFKRYLALANVARRTRTGPFYRGLPRYANRLDSWDADKLVLCTNLDYWRLYSRFLHACLTGQFDLGSTLTRYRNVASLDRHSLDTFFAPFRPLLSRPLSDSCLARWDRNATEHYPQEERPVQVDSSLLHWNDADAFRAMTPLYHDYRAEGDGTVVNVTGVPLDRNTIAIARYLITFFNSANDYRRKLTETARLVQTQNYLEQQRKKLVDQLVGIQRRKQGDVNRLMSSGRLNAAQHEIVRRFNANYRQTVQQLTNAAAGRNR